MHHRGNFRVRTFFLRTVGVLAALGALSGCTSTYQVKIAALRSPESAPRQTYRLVSAVEGRDLVDPQYAAVAVVVERALAARGLHAASRPEWADVEIRLDFGIGPHRLKPVSAPDGRGGDGMVFIPDRRSGGTIADALGANVPASSLRQVVAMREKRLSLVARENAMGGMSARITGPELWRVEVVIDDAGDTFAELLPILAGAMVPYIDEAVATDRVDLVSKSAPAVLLVSQGS